MKRHLLAAGLLSLTLLGPATGRTFVGVVTTNLALWLKADAGVTADGSGNVSAWADQSGQGHNGTAAGSAEPLLISGALGGLPVVQFNGTSNFLNLAGQVLTSQQFTIIAVVSDARAAGDGTNREIFSNWSGSNESTSTFFGTTGTNPVRARLSDNFGGVSDPNGNTSGVGALVNPASPFIFTGESGGSNATISQNGTLLASLGQALASRTFTTPYIVGQQGSLGSEFWQGDVAELLVYNAALTPAQVQQDMAYLNFRYFGGPDPDAPPTPTPVPEPSSLALLLLGGALAAWRRRHRAGTSSSV